MKNKKYDVRRLTLDGMLTAILVILGMIKLPSIIPGAEFQLSAPYAVVLASFVGFYRYLGIGMCASAIQLLLGTHTIYNVVVALVFRIVAGLIIKFCPKKEAIIAIAGPLGTACARIVMSLILFVPVLPLLVAAVPGMIFTAFVAVVLRRILKKNIRF